MSGRGGVRSSARLVGEVPTGPAPSRGRPPCPSAAATERRARAAERAREVEDSPRELRDKCRRLARALRNAKHLVVYTGAGISTAADIPDYRGPAGVWTRLARGERVGRVEVAAARPTYTHMALSALWSRGALKFVVSQNCDGLHVRAGLPRRALAELHGDMFAERCPAPTCRRVYLRAFDTTERTARHAHGTRRLCHACGAELQDSIVHFGERGRAAWPLNWAGALRAAARADVVLCLGSSLKVLRRYPRLWRMEEPRARRPQLYVVNLQWTPKDAVATLKINARCDAVMRQVARRLRLRVPRYRAERDPLLAHAEPLQPHEQHTTRRTPLTAPALDSASDSADSWGEPSSPSASDSDEEVPLRHLAERLRAPPSPCPPLAPPDPPDVLRAFQVRLQAGDATILLRAHHAAPPPPPHPPPAHPPPPTGDLRSFRMVRPVARELNNECKLRHLLQYEPRIEAAGGGGGKHEPRAPTPAISSVKAEKIDSPGKEESGDPFATVKCEWKSDPKEEASSSSSSEGGGVCARSLAAAIMRRAVLLCRAQLYPGLHSIIVPPAPPECAWCARHYRAARCQWYGPARATPPAARAWRRGRYLCACCPHEAGAPRPADGAGWYGKGYRKGRRRAPRR